MTVTKGVQAATAVTKAKDAREKYVAYGLRGPAWLKKKCEEIAAAETKKVGFPVSASGVMRKFIVEGCEGWED